MYKEIRQGRMTSKKKQHRNGQAQGNVQWLCICNCNMGSTKHNCATVNSEVDIIHDGSSQLQFDLTQPTPWPIISQLLGLSAEVSKLI